jgi:WD40 repeat protein
VSDGIERWALAAFVFARAHFSIMSQKLEYQERYHRLAHESTINTLVLSPNGRRLVTGGDDSTVLVWSTQSGVTLFRIKAHSPILSLAWLGNTNGFIFGCQNGMLASVELTDSEVWSSEAGSF